MRKRILAIILSGILMVSVTGCGQGANKNSKNKNSTENSETVNGRKSKKYQDMGFEFTLGEVWSKYPDNLMLGGVGDAENKEEPFYGGLQYGFISNELLKEYDEVSKGSLSNEEKNAKIDEIFSKVKTIMGMVSVRSEIAPDEAKIKETMDCDIVEKVGEHDGLIFYFCYNEANSEGLSDEAANMLKDVSTDISAVKESFKTSKPITPQEAITSLGKISFKLKDMNGKEIDSAEFFKEKDVTMINIWGTFCNPCISEMPDLQAINEEWADKGLQVLGIIGDTPDEENEALAKKIYESKGVKYTSLIPDEAIKKDLISTIAGYPTTLFVDKEGKIIGEVVTGSRSKEEYEEIIQKVFDSMK